MAGILMAALILDGRATAIAISPAQRPASGKGS